MTRYRTFILVFAVVHALTAMSVGFEARQVERRARALDPTAVLSDSSTLNVASRVLAFPVVTTAPWLFFNPLLAYLLNGAVWGIALVGVRVIWRRAQTHGKTSNTP